MWKCTSTARPEMFALLRSYRPESARRAGRQHRELSLVCQGLPLSTRKSFVDWLPTILPPAPDSRFQIRKPGEVQSFAQVTLRCRPRIHTQAVWLQNLFVTTVLCRLPWQCPSVNAICFQHWHQEYCWICTRSAADGWPGR